MPRDSLGSGARVVSDWSQGTREQIRCGQRARVRGQKKGIRRSVVDESPQNRLPYDPSLRGASPVSVFRRGVKKPEQSKITSYD